MRIPRNSLRAAILLFLLLALPAHALIRGPNPPSFQSHTLEAITADSPVIIIATVVSGAIRTYDWQATFTTGEILKSPPGYVPGARFNATLEFFRTSYNYVAGDEKQFQFPPPGSRVLLFLSDDGGLYDCVLIDAHGPARSMLSASVVDLTLKNLPDDQTVLKMVRAELLRVPATPNALFTYYHPSSVNNVPNDDRLLPAARQWIHSDNAADRLIGVRVLQQFPDPQDIESLKALLNDPALFGDVFISPWSGESHLVRLAAWQALSDQGVHVSLPVVNQPVAGLYKPLSWLWPILIIPGPWILYFAWRGWAKRRKFAQSPLRRSLANFLIILCFIYILTVIPLWRRSLTSADDIVWARHGLLINVASVKGNLYLECALSWPAESPLVHAAIAPNAAASDLLTRDQGFWNRFGYWDSNDSLWSAYCDPRGYPRVQRVIGVMPIQARFPFPIGRVSPFPPSKGILIGCHSLYLIILLLAFPLLRLILRHISRLLQFLRLRRLAKAGLCPTCAYDLRAHRVGERCPECGTLIAIPHLT